MCSFLYTHYREFYVPAFSLGQGSIVFWEWLFSVVLRVTCLDEPKSQKMISWEFLQNVNFLILNDGQQSQQALFGELVMGLPWHLLLCQWQRIAPLGITQLYLLHWWDFYMRASCNFNFPVLKDDFMISEANLKPRRWWFFFLLMD